MSAADPLAFAQAAALATAAMAVAAEHLAAAVAALDELEDLAETEGHDVDLLAQAHTLDALTADARNIDRTVVATIAQEAHENGQRARAAIVDRDRDAWPFMARRAA